MNVSLGVIGAIVVLVIIGIILLALNARKRTAEDLAKQEALFASMFPELQPHYHPKNVLEFVRARLAQAPARGGMRMKDPPGFGVDFADISYYTDKKGRERELWVLLDDARGEVSRFFFESDKKDGMVRVGEGKFRVARKEDRVRYWHPDREFKWTPPGSWKFITRVFDREVDHDRGSTSFSDSSSRSTTAATAAAAAGIAAAGGTFDGGGASAAWDGAAGAGRSESSDSDTSTAGAPTY